MDIFPTDLHPSFAEALAALPSQRAAPATRGRRLFGKGRAEIASGPAAPVRLASGELLKIAAIGKNDPVVRSYFAAVAELSERQEESGATDGLYLRGLNDALDAYLRFDERRAKIEHAVRRIGSMGTYEEERRRLEARLASVRDEIARQVLCNALDELGSRSTSFDALRIDLERIEARKAMVAQRLAAVRELLILDSLNTGEGTADGGGLALLRALNDDLAKDAVFAQRTEAEQILRSIDP